ncbi:MAG: ABC transporter substrate-binding protein [Dehalococcoidia bacterium]|nr:ABC transporter substrate-binding protein [Dehalococcoidia bacterium]
MNRNWKRAMAALLVLVLVVPLCVSCGEEEEEGVVTITIGEMTDLTGPASPAIIPLHWALEDIVSYYNEEELIPGVKFDMVSWDTRYEPARDIPGYDWVRGHGAELIVAVPPPTGVALKTFADRDEFPIVCLSTNVPMLEPPGWVFCMSNSHYSMMKTFLKWLSEEDPHFPTDRPAKIGLVGWSETATMEDHKAIGEYCQDHSDEFVYAGHYIVPMGTMTWSGEVEKLKGCDYIEAKGFPTGGFINEFIDKGYRTNSEGFFDVGTASSYRGFLVDQCGWERLDGLLTPNMSLMWNEPTPLVELAKELVYKYHPGKAEETIYAGLAYVGGILELVATFHILEQAIAEVGAENFDGQAFYDAAIEYKTGGPLWEGYPEGWGFTETKRYLADHIAIYEFNAEAEDLVWDGDWVPLVLE